MNRKYTVFPVDPIKLVLISFFVLLFGFLVVFQFHVEVVGYLGFGGLFVPDAMGMQGSLYAIANGVDVDYRTIAGVVFLYYPSYWLGNFYCYLVNAVLLFFSCLFFIKTSYQLGIKLTYSSTFIVLFSVLANFYILGVMLHPNKEIPLIFLTNLFVYFAVLKKQIVLPVLIIAISSMFRDGYGLILLLTFISLNIKFFNQMFYKVPYLVSASLVVILSVFGLNEILKLNLLSEFNSILERNLSLSAEDTSSYRPFILKFLSNLFSGAIRPQLLDLNGRINFVGVGLWQFGVVIMLGVMSWMYILGGKSKNYNLSRLTMVIFFCLLFISLGTIAQPRYMMPYIFWLSTGFVMAFRIDFILILFLGVCLLSIIFSVVGLGVKVPLGIDSYPFFN